MTFVVLFILAVLWALYLASWARNRTTVRRGNSVSSFSQHLSVLRRTQPGAPQPNPAAGPVTAEQANIGSFSSLAPAERDPMVRPPAVRGLTGGAPVTQRDAKRRRRDITFGLIALAALATAGAVAIGGPALWLAAVGWIVVGFYVFLLARSQQIAAEREAKVHYIQPAAAQQPAQAEELYGHDVGPVQEIFYDEYGYPVDQYGRPCDDYGRLVDEDGYLFEGQDEHAGYAQPQAHSYA